MYSTQEKETEAMNNTACEAVMFIHSTGAAAGDNLLLITSESILPSMTFNKATAAFSFIWTELRIFLVSRVVALKVHQQHCTIYTVAYTIFTDPDENKTSLELCNRIFSGTVYQNSTDVSHIPGDNEASVRSQHHSEKKTAHNMAIRLKNCESKFSGDLFLYWQDYKD